MENKVFMENKFLLWQKELLSFLGEYLENSENSKLKEVVKIEQVINSKDNFYLLYPIFFINQEFIKKNKEFVYDICLASYFYYKHLLISDQFVDSKFNEINYSLFITSNTLLEESLKLLSFKFSSDSNFWEIWNQRSYSFISFTSTFEKENSSYELPDGMDVEHFSDMKSHFAKIPIDIAHLLTFPTKHSMYSKLLESQKKFSYGFQILDDIIDFKEDHQNQFNISHNRLFLFLGFKKYKEYEISELNNLLYTSKVVDELIDESLNQFYLSKSLIIDFKEKFPLWDSLINMKIKNAKVLKNNINSYHLKLENSIEHIFKNNSSKKLTENKIKSSLIKSSNYLNSHENFPDLWHNFGLKKNFSDGLVKFILNKNKQSTNNELCGDNNFSAVDIESSILSFKLNDNNSISFINDFLRNDGGVSKYRSAKELQSSYNSLKPFKFWLKSQNCTTSLILFSLINYQGKEAFLLKNKMKSYLIKNITPEGQLESYWWTSSVFASSYTLMYLIKVRENIEDQKRLANYILSQISEDGFIKNKLNEPSPYFTALGIESLLSIVDFKFSKNNSNIINSSVNWIINNQINDGSFPSSFIYQIPNPEEEICKVNEWKKKNKDYNTFLNDYNRFITTSQCLKMFKQYNLWNGR
jgi:hypothetical protein